MAKTFTSGSCSVSIDHGRLVMMLDKVSQGAASRFISLTTTMLEGVRDDALPTWPVRSGRSKSGLKIGTTVKADAIEVMIYDEQAYTYKIKWSYLTKVDIDQDVAKAASRGLTPESQAKIEKVYRRKMEKKHGPGAPTEELSGKHVWTTSIRAPVKAKTQALVDTLQDDVLRLAGAR